MIFTNTITLILALAPTTLFAAPTRTVGTLSQLFARSIPAQALNVLENGTCDLSAITMPTAPTPLPAPASGLKLTHVALGRGTQNYTCTSPSAALAPVQVGASATLFNATCGAVRAPAVLKDVTTLALSQPIPTNDIANHMLSGHHWFSAEGNPFFNLDTDSTKYGQVTSKKNATSNAPTTSSKGTNDLGSVPWLKLTALTGADGSAWAYKEIYRLETAGGVAPKTCEGVNGTFQVDYSAVYYFWA